MPSASYYREQAKLLFQLSLTTSDQKLAAQYSLKAQELLLLAIETAENGDPTLRKAGSLFNAHRIRKA